ncbi:helicase C-terminal domain-containing protein [Trichloromonas sp.]|uniref:helicase C-terminal domain-containing protein n=1 Tax=Trichloromonas sp. TaxID=3069249 RepID=UPI002A42CC1A|nr:helicase C-terminal domain-containing protein [Trichloromonas sp.]
MYENKIYHPLKYNPRDIQIDALNFTKTNINRGKKYILINAPTGIGKSFFSVMFMNWYLNYINDDARFDILTNSKILQNQYVKEFPFMKSLKGRNSYTCDTYNCSCAEGKEFNKALKKKCTDCPYDRAFSEWKSTNTAMTNFHLFNTIHLFLPKLIEEKKSNVLIIDEADSFESVLCDYISMKISHRSLKLMGFNDTNINHVYREISKVKNIFHYIDFVKNYFLNILDEISESLLQKLGNPSIIQSEKIKISKYITNINGAKESYTAFINDIDGEEGNINNWVIDIDKDESKIFPTNYSIQPVWSNKYLYDVIWKHYDHVIFMSGTILDKDMFAYMNGLDTKLCCYYSVPSPFKVRNRPIYYIKVGKMTYTEKEKTWEKQKLIIDKIIKKNKNNKGIIHTTNYELSNWLQEYYKNDDRFIFHKSDDRDQALYKHITSTKPTILVSPSMMSGVDLKDELSRFQIIMKIPYPNISSNKIKKRQKDNKDWYSWRTVADIIQSYGRSIRSDDDFAETYIIDESFSNILRYNYKFLPDWFTDAIKTLK